jgi:hypothetical protein
MVVADELEGVGDGLDEIFLADGRGHGGSVVGADSVFGWWLMTRVCIMILSVQAMARAETRKEMRGSRSGP